MLLFYFLLFKVMPAQIITPELHVGKIPYRLQRELADLLDIQGPHDWRALIAELPDGTYTRTQIEKFERVVNNQGCSSALALLADLGHQLMTVGELTEYLDRIDHQEALLLIKPHEPVFISRQPSSVVAQVGKDVCLSCHATGFPRPRYQWYKYQCELRGKCTPELKLKDVTQEMNGDYYCKITNPVGSEYSEVVSIQVTPMIAAVERGVTAPENSKLESKYRQDGDSVDGFNEEIVMMYPGQYFVLTCDTPADRYQWYKNGYPIMNACQQNLVFKEFQLADDGHYSCKINIGTKEIVTRLAHLKLDSSNKDPRHPGLVQKEFATAKLALVIANQKYQYPRNSNEILVHPFDDAILLAETLEKIGFKVTCLVNLTKKEMEAAIDGFCKLLECTKGAYSLFYFCGHGFEEHGKTYLVPTDASREWTADVALSAEYVLSKIQHCKTTKLDVMLLDVCRISVGNEINTSDLKKFDPPFLPGAQCVFGYATCPQSQAFEKRRDPNGIYMKHLAHHLTQNIQVETLLHKVGIVVREEAELHHITNSMSPTFKSTTTRVFSLCDNILPPAFSVTGERDPNVEWFDYHRLPASRSILFDHGIVIEIRFLPVCSNISNVVIHVASMGETTCCDAKIIEICDEIEVPYDSMNREMSLLPPQILSKSLQFNASNSPVSDERPSVIERWTQVSGLQKVKGPFLVTIEVEYTPHDSLDEETRHSSKVLVFRKDEFGIISLFKTSSI